MTLIWSFDLDSTVANTQHRRHMILDDRSQMTDRHWIDYSLACVDDTDGPAAPLIRAVIEQQACAPHELKRDADGLIDDSTRCASIDFIIVSRRDNAARDLSTQWLNARGWAPRELIMLKDTFDGSEARSQAQWKVNAIKAYEARTGDRVVLHVDDYMAVTEAMLANGIPAITIRGEEEGEYAFGHVKEITSA